MVYQDGQYQIVLKYQTVDGRVVEAFLTCQVPMNHECSLPFEQRLACGPRSVSAVACRQLGCCYCPDTQICYYPMDECTADGHFVFSIPASLTDPPLSPDLLVAAGNSSCTPQKVVADLALFKIPLDGCGARKYEVGNTVIYMLEILNTLQSVTLNYGTITRVSPFRLLVECRFLPGSVASVGYLVKSPTLGPAIQAQGVFGVQLRIAKDQQYSSYYPQYHRPLRKLLGKPLYLEVRLLNPVDPSAVLLVHYCVAYPRSAHSAWVLLYDGCPNPFDVTPSHETPATLPEGMANHVRRFTVSTFQFLENSRKEMVPGEDVEEVEENGEEEEIYFMCATEVCLPSEGPCVEGCIDSEYLTLSS
ncbi:zona pellucida sperm-binding protein 4 [Neoarius graeffei]|uniref:zona pellucida sperm-binding protein 4 n=1 Tax=Neoarius graeffei TaxID=443677 RepID=UPI00298C31A8|nr:zona pellucida sperm-binding protein 4 [Neoarius graeffei]